MSIKLTAAYKTDVGKQREQNEDTAFFKIADDRGLFIVADGMGGYQAGEVASKLAVEKISEVLQSFLVPITEQPTIRLVPADLGETLNTGQVKPGEASPKPQKTRKLAETPVVKNVEEQLKAAIQQANMAILRYGEQQAGARGLGCTWTTALVQDDR